MTTQKKLQSVDEARLTALYEAGQYTQALHTIEESGLLTALDEQPDASEQCAAERDAESLTQSGGTRREVPGSSGSPEGKSQRGKEHAREAGVTRRRRQCRPARPA